jgi:hypothetical protein
MEELLDIETLEDAATSLHWKVGNRLQIEAASWMEWNLLPRRLFSQKEE